MAAGPHERAEIALEIAEVYATLFRWADAVDVLERALAEVGEIDPAFAARIEGELVVCGLHDARRASRVRPVLQRLSSRPLAGTPAEALAVAQGMALTLAGRPARRGSLSFVESSRARRRARRELGYASCAATESCHRRAV